MYLADFLNKWQCFSKYTFFYFVCSLRSNQLSSCCKHETLPTELQEFHISIFALLSFKLSLCVSLLSSCDLFYLWCWSEEGLHFYRCFMSSCPMARSVTLRLSLPELLAVAAETTPCICWAQCGVCPLIKMYSGGAIKQPQNRCFERK